LNTNNAPGLLEGGSEFTDAVTAPAVVVEPGLQASRKACRPTVPAPTNRAEYCKKPRRLSEDPKSFGTVPMKDLLLPKKGNVYSVLFLGSERRRA
jgi:hypothetical protein